MADDLDYRTDRLNPKPLVHGPVDANAFAVVAAATRALKKEGHRDLATQLGNEYMRCESYDQLLALVQCYVDFDL